jgi:putative phage-type endonuclease
MKKVKMKILNLEPNTPEWESYRKSVIGASDCAAIMGCSPFQTALDVWNSKMGISNQPVNAAMRRGTFSEPFARALFETYIGKKVTPCVVEHPKHPWLIASLDGLSQDHTLICEIKTPSKEVFEKGIRGVIPDHYYIQMQAQLACTGLKICHYVLYDGDKIHVDIVPWDDEEIEKILEVCGKFYHENMLGFTAPDNDPERDYLDMKSMWMWGVQENKYKDICQKIELLESEKEACRIRMINMSMERNAKGSQYRLTKVMSKGKIDYSKIEELKEIDLEKYRGKPTESYRITAIKGEKE